MKPTRDQLRELQHAYDVISNVQVDMYNDSENGEPEVGQWRTLWDIRSKLGIEIARLRKVTNYL
jgi:hypothetical protein